LSRHNIGIPTTTFVKDKKDVLPAIERVGGAPIVIKLLEGTQGIGVLLAHTLEMAQSIIELLQSQKQNILIQKFVAESKGKDIRATYIMGLGIAGVDMLEGKDGPQIMEINSSPGLEGIENCSGKDVAGSFIDYIASRVDYPEIDYRQKLTVSRGYGVTELYIPSCSEYVGKTILESGLREKDINVFSLHRGKKVIPNPKSERRLEPEDRLLCFGKLEYMKELIPEKTRKPVVWPWLLEHR